MLSSIKITLAVYSSILLTKLKQTGKLKTVFDIETDKRRMI